MPCSLSSSSPSVSPTFLQTWASGGAAVVAVSEPPHRRPAAPAQRAASEDPRACRDERSAPAARRRCPGYHRCAWTHLPGRGRREQAAAPIATEPRPVLILRQDRPHPRVEGVAAGRPDGRAGDARGLEPPEAPTAAWRAAPRPRGGRRRRDGAVRRRWGTRGGTVIWATGFRTDHAWIDVPVPDNRGRPVHQRGVTGWPGLCFLRLTWQHTRARRSWAG